MWWEVEGVFQRWWASEGQQVRLARWRNFSGVYLANGFKGWMKSIDFDRKYFEKNQTVLINFPSGVSIFKGSITYK